jgi:hypothetical protein
MAESAPAVSTDISGEVKEAVATAEVVLEQQRRAYAVIVSTHQAIPDLLAEKLTVQSQLGQCEVSNLDLSGLPKRLDAVEAERQSQIRQRQSALDMLESQEPELMQARAGMDSARQSYADRVIAEFLSRYQEAVGVLQRLWESRTYYPPPFGPRFPHPCPYVYRVVRSHRLGRGRRNPTQCDFSV